MDPIFINNSRIGSPFYEVISYDGLNDRYPVVPATQLIQALELMNRLRFRSFNGCD